MQNNKIQYIKRVILLTLIALCNINTYGAERGKVEVIGANPKFTTSFAIFTDATTFERCKADIIAYKNILESEGLGAYIISANWQTPEEVKGEINKLSGKKSILEGMVFIGDIPIARVRKGQHLTTAFKMNEQTFPMVESSVTSDRFYDCPDLKFDFIKRDSINANWFYYNLSPYGAQKLIPAYYSARMIVPQELVETTGKDKYELMSKYLQKVVAVHKENNPLDKFIYFAGHGYNSDCLTAWRQQSIAFKGYFPKAFEQSTGNTFLNFRQDPQIKFSLFSQMQKPDVDVFMFYEHGGPQTQYINGSYPAENMGEYLKVLRYELRNAYKRVKGDKKEAFIKDVCTHFGFDKQMFSPEAIAAAKQEDSIMKFNKDIHLADLSKLKTGARFTMFNACYNGSFHEKGFIAGYHIFNDGKTVVTQGNTVNVLQDKWAEQLIGILSLGARIGFWQNEVVTLESHLVGDPTFRFTAISKDYEEVDFIENINKNLVVNKNNLPLWEGLLNSKTSILRALGIKQLLKNYLAQNVDARGKSPFSDKIFARFNNDNSMIVRMQALHALSYCNDKNFTSAVIKGLDDPYEMIRRQSAHWAGKIGDEQLIPMLKNLKENALEVQRVGYASQTALDCFATNKVIDAKSIRLLDDIRRLRNYPNHPQVNHLLGLLSGIELSGDAKLILCEALGWFGNSINKDKIIEYLEREVAAKQADKELLDEMLKTLKRLRLY